MAKTKAPTEDDINRYVNQKVTGLSIDSALAGQAGAVKLMTAIVKLKEDIVKKYEDKRAHLEAAYNAELELIKSLKETMELNK